MEEAENRLTQQAFSRVQYGTGKRDTAANKFLRRGLGHLIPSDPDHAEAGPFSLFYATPEQRANINIYVNQAEDVIDAYQQAGIEQPSLQAILDDAKEHGEYSEQMAKNLIVGSLAIGGLVLAPIAASTATAAELAAFASNPVNYCLGNPIGCTIGAEEVALAVTGVAAPSSLVPSVVTKLDDVIEGVIRTGDDAAKAAIKTRVPEVNLNPKFIEFDEATGFGRADPKDIKFSQPTASPNFSDGKNTINSTVTDLQNPNNPLTADDLKPIRVVEVDGELVSLDNRRLATFNAAGIEDITVQRVSLDDPKIAAEFDLKYRPVNGGENIVITPRSGRTEAERILEEEGKIDPR